MIIRDCPYCGSPRPWRFNASLHEKHCPAYGRQSPRLSKEQRVFFEHPDLIEIDLIVANWYPSR
jgi:hypothetical protein